MTSGKREDTVNWNGSTGSHSVGTGFGRGYGPFVRQTRKINKWIRLLGVILIFIFGRASLETAHNDGCGPLPQKVLTSTACTTFSNEIPCEIVTVKIPWLFCRIFLLLFNCLDKRVAWFTNCLLPNLFFPIIICRTHKLKSRKDTQSLSLELPENARWTSWFHILWKPFSCLKSFHA